MVSKILIDTNVLIDYILEREPFFDDAMAMLRYSIEEERKQKPRLNTKVKGGI